jgi:hypothetical protein
MLADLYAEQGSYREAKRALDDIIETLPGTPFLLLDRASVECNLADDESCLGDLTAALGKSPLPTTILSAAAIVGRAISSRPRLPGSELRSFLVSLGEKSRSEHSAWFQNSRFIVIVVKFYSRRVRPKLRWSSFARLIL